MGHILVVNDTNTTLRLIERQLRNNGHDVFTATNGMDALSLLDRRSVDLIITDIHMPGIDGWQFCRLLKSEEYRQFNEIPVLFMSATEQDAKVANLVSRMKGVGFLAVPWDQTEFLSVVNKILQGDRAPLQNKVTVLVADDSEIEQRLIRHALEGHGYEVISVYDGRECIERIEGLHPHLLLLDQMMPEMTGLEVLKWVKEQDLSIPIIMITAGGSEKLAVEVMRHGAYDYVKKPLNVDKLLELCEDTLEHHSASVINRMFKVRIQQIQEMQEKLVEAERLRALVEIAGGAAHAIFQPLTVILGESQLLQMRAPEHVESLKQIEASALRIQRIVKCMGDMREYETKPYVGKDNIVDFERGAKSEDK